MVLHALLRTLRPYQWVKNVFVLAPLVFSKQLLTPKAILLALGATGLFCLASGLVYLINDLVDVDRDRKRISLSMRQERDESRDRPSRNG